MAQFCADRISVGSSRARTPEGYLLVKNVPLARTGSQQYRADEVDREGTMGLNGIVEVIRPPEEVFAARAIASFEGKAVVSPHPPQFLTADNTAIYAKGHVQNVHRGPHPETGEEVLLGDLLITDATLIGMIEEDIRKELSCGYTYDLDYQNDEHSPYPRFLQRNIFGNHVAVVSSARAGSAIRVLDAAPKEETPMAEEAKAVTAPNELGTLSQIGAFFKGLGLRLVAEDAAPVRKVEAQDGESEAVERNRKVNERAMSLRSRVMDEDPDEADKDAKKPDDEKDDPDKKDIKKKGEDARAAMDAKLLRAIDTLTQTVARATGQDAACDCDMPDGKHAKDCASHDKEGKDADLIPVETLSGDEIPENPIPGADAALAELRKMRQFVAQSGNRQAIDSYNEAVKRLKNNASGEDGYGALLNGRKKPEEVADAEARASVSRVGAHDSREKVKEDFVDTVAKFHRQNAQEVKLEKKAVN